MRFSNFSNFHQFLRCESLQKLWKNTKKTKPMNQPFFFYANQVRIESCIIIDFCQCNCVLYTHIKTTKTEHYRKKNTQREQCLWKITGINKPLQKIDSNDILVSEYWQRELIMALLMMNGDNHDFLIFRFQANYLPTVSLALTSVKRQTLFE